MEQELALKLLKSSEKTQEMIAEVAETMEIIQNSIETMGEKVVNDSVKKKEVEELKEGNKQEELERRIEDLEQAVLKLRIEHMVIRGKNS